MLEINYNAADYINFVEIVAAAFQVPVKANGCSFSPNHGFGYIWAERLPIGLSILVGDTRFNEDVLLHRISSSRQYFILQFNEMIDIEKNKRSGIGVVNDIVMEQSNVLLTNSIMPIRYMIPRGIQLRTVKLIFEKKFLLQFFDEDTVDVLISHYFSGLLQKGKTEYIDEDYRELMNELIRPKIENPLRIQFIQNQSLLLLERFVHKFLTRIQTAEKATILTEDAISRLMKVEATLVKDFSTAPPTINVLSRYAAMSATKLKQDFKLLYGMPIYEYYQKNRMLHARMLILKSVYSMKEVGNMVGYSNLGHFAASFKKEFGVLPSEVSAIAQQPPLLDEAVDK